MEKVKSSLLRLLSAIMFVTLLVSCSDTGSEPGSNPSPNPLPTPIVDFAPKDVVGKEFRFYRDGADKYSFKVTAASNASDAKISTGSSQYIIISAPYFYYDKIDTNEAEVLCSFYYSLLGIVGQDNIFDYELELTFLSENYGTYEGVLTHHDSKDDWTSVSGVFVFDSKKEPDELAAELEESNENKTKINWNYLTSNTWLFDDSNYDIYMIFDDNGNFRRSFIYGSESFHDKMTYQIDKTENIISLYLDGVSLENYKVVELSQNTLTIITQDFEGNYPQAQARTYHATENEIPEEPSIPQAPDIAISEPIIENITETSAIVKGTILGENVTFQERGVCYSTETNPTISDNVVRSNSDIINIPLSNLYEGTPYYVRLYAKVDGKITYGEQGSFITAGTATSNIEISASKVGLCQLHLNVKLPNKIKKYGLCYGTSPNPLVTDNATEEASRETIEWRLDKLTADTKYYIRAYHIDGSKIVYYEDSETEIFTLGNNIDVSYDIYDSYFNNYGYLDFVFISSCNITYNNLPEGFYNVKLCWYGMDSSDTISGVGSNGVHGSSGNVSIRSFTMKNILYGSTWTDRYGRMENNTDIIIKFTQSETGIIYYSSYKLIYDRNNHELKFQLNKSYDETVHDMLLDM